jgi:HD-GYP domain-containing protein (c-di-GMP phosphodiesterase class II)
MIGAYSTANLAGGNKFGVIVMQDADKALATVGEMRSQVWFISIGFAVLALIAGLFLSGQITAPLSSLVAAAERIAKGDLSARIEEKRITELSKLGITFNTMSDELETYIADLARAAKENRELFVGTVKALAAAIDGKDRYTRGHSERVSRVSTAIGQRMGMDEEELEKLRISALLHDVGKIGIDDAILKKPSALTDAEYEIMKTHPQQGYKIMKNIPAMKEFLPGMYMHHEMVNGEGYPQGLKDEEIPLQAKIVSVADTFDAMTIDRPYQKGMGLEDALERIKTFVGTRYDLKVVDALIKACAEGQIGVGRVKLKTFEKENTASKREVA